MAVRNLYSDVHIFGNLAVQGAISSGSGSSGPPGPPGPPGGVIESVNGLIHQFVQWSASVSTFPAVPGVLHLASASGGNIIMQLPPAASVAPGSTLVVKRVDSAGNIVTVQPIPGEKVNGLTAGVVLSQQGQGRWFWPGAPAGAAAGMGWMSY